MNSKVHLYPLSAYDKDGKLKPPSISYWCGLYAIKGLLILMFSSVRVSNSETVLGIFYPEPIYLVFGLLAGIPGMITLVVLSYRDIVIEKYPRFFAIGVKLVQVSLLLHISIALAGLLIAKMNVTPFSFVGIIIPVTLWYYLVNNPQMKDFLEDWSNPDTENASEKTP
jgi:ABC-type glucose/galactose transport system permease subunit